MPNTNRPKELNNLKKTMLYMKQKEYNYSNYIPSNELNNLANDINKLLSNGTFRTFAMATPTIDVGNPATQFTKNAKAGKYDDLSDEGYDKALDTIKKKAALWNNRPYITLDIMKEYMELEKGLTLALASIHNILDYTSTVEECKKIDREYYRTLKEEESDNEEFENPMSEDWFDNDEDSNTDKSEIESKSNENENTEESATDDKI